jgi:hypothetical protein
MKQNNITTKHLTNKIMTITITNKDGLNQISTFSDEKIKHITETNQWGHVIETILRDSNRENMKQTPVEWLEDALFKIHGSSTDMNGTSKFLEKEFKELFVQAKEMENQQGHSDEDGEGKTNNSIKIDYSKVIKTQPRIVNERFPKEEQNINELQGSVMNLSGAISSSFSIQKEQRVMFKFDEDEPMYLNSIYGEGEFILRLKEGKIKFEKDGKTFELYVETI